MPGAAPSENPEPRPPEPAAPHGTERQRGFWRGAGRRFWRGFWQGLWRWTRRLFRAFVAVVLLLALFHQPLLKWGLREGADRWATRRGIRLSLRLEGNVWRRLTVRDLQMQKVGEPLGDTRPSSLESAKIEELHLEYDLPALAKNAWAQRRRGRAEKAAQSARKNAPPKKSWLRGKDFLRSCRMRNATLVFVPPRNELTPSERLAERLRVVFEPVILECDRLEIENLDMIAHTTRGVYEWRGMNALLVPPSSPASEKWPENAHENTPGFLSIARMILPGWGNWSDVRELQAAATYENRRLTLEQLVYKPGGDFQPLMSDAPPPAPLHMRRLELDASQRREGKRTLALEADWMGGKISATLERRATKNNAAENAEPSMRASLSASAERLPLGELARSLGELRILDKSGESDAEPLRERLKKQLVGRLDGRLESARLQLSGDPLHPGDWRGSLTANGGDVRFREFAAKRIKINLPLEAGELRNAHLELVPGGSDMLVAEGTVTLKSPRTYAGTLRGNIGNIAIFQPFAELLAKKAAPSSGEAAATKWKLGGALEMEWQGAGTLDSMRDGGQRLAPFGDHQGRGKLRLNNARLGPLTQLEGVLTGAYAPGEVVLEKLDFRCEQGALQAGIRWKEGRLNIDGIKVSKAFGTVKGDVSFPLNLQTPQQKETLFPAEGALGGSLILEGVALEKRYPDWNGNILGTLILSGSVGNPAASLKLQARQLQNRRMEKKLPPASADAELRFNADRLTLTAALAQPGLSPLRIDGELPLNLARLLAERRLEPSTPLRFSAKLPRSSAAFFTPFLPRVRFLEGALSLDLSVAGTLENPILSGFAALDAPAVRFRDTRWPGINDLRAELCFAGRELAIQRFTGNVAGGPFTVTGRVAFDAPTSVEAPGDAEKTPRKSAPLHGFLRRFANPQLALQAHSEGTLLARNDRLILRANSRLELAGPLREATLRGSVGITKSRFFREIEILPIGLPGQSAPKKRAPAGGQPRSLSIAAAPFRDWRYDVNIVTVEPFLVKGNMANGGVTLRLHLGGSGFAPALEGVAQLEDFEASLPFSRLTIDHGTAYFSGGTLNPALDIRGSSRIREYNVHLYLHGTAGEPQTLFTSEPALPQEEIVALLATGALASEISQSSEAAAGRAAALLFQDLYRRAFPRRAPLADNPELDRFSLDVGGVDPRTGQQELTGRYRLSDAYEVSAGVDLQGDMRVRLQYLIRFK